MEVIILILKAYGKEAFEIREDAIVVKIHGASDYRAVKNAIMQCVGFVENNLKEKIKVLSA